jgi:DNA-directed RNA polymerase beta' subunit
MIPKLKETLYHQYHTTVCAAGESVGVITAQSIGERQTQNTLNTFHNTGLVVKTVVMGVPRFSELMNATKDPKAPACTIYFTENNDSIASIKKMINHSIKEIKFGELISRVKCGKNLPTDEWYEEYELIYNDEYKKFEWSVQLDLNLEMLYDFWIPLEKIAKKISEEYGDLVCVFSPDYIGKMHIYIDVTDITDEDLLYEDENEMYMAYIEEIVVQLLKNVQLFGITGIKNIFFQKVKNDKKEDEWILDTDGSNFKDVLAHPKVDKIRTISNNMWEIYETLGIEATRNFLINEFASVVSSDGTFVNDSHIMLLVDIMTFSGNIISISRYGMKKENCGPMAKASFEESLDNFLKAGAFGEKETTNGVSASIMLGKLSKFGTGICDVLVDIDRLPDKPVIEERIIEKTDSDEKEVVDIDKVLKAKTEKRMPKRDEKIRRKQDDDDIYKGVAAKPKKDTLVKQKTKKQSTDLEHIADMIKKKF